MNRPWSFLLALCLALSGCTAMRQASDVHQSNITWVKVKPTTCGAVADAAGCAYTFEPLTDKGNTCILIMENDASDWVVAHEVRHCFGWVHK